MDKFETFGTYQLYKAGQQKFTTWLVRTARRYEGQLNLSTSTTEKQIPKGPTKSTCLVHYTQLEELATIVVSNAPSEKIPVSILQTLRDVITRRRQSSLFFQRKVDKIQDKFAYEAIQRSNAGHLHIIGLLENILKLLENKVKVTAVKEHPKKDDDGICMSRNEAQLCNVFEVLEVEETRQQPSVHEDFSDPESRPKPNKNRAQRRTKKQSSAKKTKGLYSGSSSADIDAAIADLEYEMEVNDSDIFMLLYCFFEDFNQIRECLQERWCDYDDGYLSLSTMGVVTNTAFDIFQRSEKELYAQISRGSGLRNYENIAHKLVNNLVKSSIYKDSPEEDGFSEAHWVCWPLYVQITHILNTLPRNTDVRTLMTNLMTMPVNHTHDKNGNSIRCGTFRYLRDIICAVCFFDSYKIIKEQQGSGLFAEDELSRGISEMLVTREIPLWLLLSFQVYLDIRRILESIRRPYYELLAAGSRAIATLEEFIEDASTMSGSPYESHIENVLADLHFWIGDDDHFPTVTRVHSFPYHPILCGIMHFRFNSTMHQLGIQACNWQPAVLDAAHIYNAVRQEIPGSQPWKDMNALIAIHGPEHIFVGGLPKTPNDYYKRYKMALGISAAMFSKEGSHSRRKNQHQTIFSTKGARFLTPTSTVSNTFHKRYCHRHCINCYTSHPVLTLPIVESLVGETTHFQPLLEEVPDLDSSSLIAMGSCLKEARISRSRAVAKQFQQSHVLTPTQVLDSLCARLSAEQPQVLFNYVYFHLRAVKLLQALYKEFEALIIKSSTDRSRLSKEDGYWPCVASFLTAHMRAECDCCSGSIVHRVEKVMNEVLHEERDVEIFTVTSIIREALFD